MKKVMYTALALLLLGLVGTGSILAEEAQPNYDAMVSDAIEVLRYVWSDVYQDDIYQGGSYQIDIRGVRIIRMKDGLQEGAEEMFADVAYIVDFLLYDDYFSASASSGHNVGYLDYSGMYNNIVIYKDGEMACGSRLIDQYRGQTYASDYGSIIEEVIDLRDSYNQVITFTK